MKNKTAKTKIIILSIIAILVILLVGFLVYRNKNKEEGSNLFSDIFSILPSSRDATEVEAIAGVAIQKNEPVYVSGVSEDGRLIVSPYRGDISSLGEIYGYATKDFSIGDIGEYELNENYKYGHDNTTKELIKTIDYKFECSDGIDNDDDGNTDADDPNCHAEGNMNKEYLPNYYSEETTITTDGWTDPDFSGGGTGSGFPPGGGGTGSGFPPGGGFDPVCSDGIDNDGDEDIDADDSACHLDGDINKEYLPNHFSENIPTSSYIDLTASSVTYTEIKLDEPAVFYTTITNMGSNKIEEEFDSFFSVKKVGEDVEYIENKAFVVPSPLGAGEGYPASFNFLIPNTPDTDETDEYLIRACADKKDASDEGKIEEFNEENNCGSWVSFKADTSITPPGEEDLPECRDGKDNDGDGKIDREDPSCREGGNSNGRYLPDYDSESEKPTECSDTIDNDGDGKIDSEDPSCREGGNSNGRYLPDYDSESEKPTECSDTIDNDGDEEIDEGDPGCHEGGTLIGNYILTHDSEEIAPAKPNICLSLEPLEFTEDEKARLDELLRKYYLIAPSLKNEADISLVYAEKTDYQNFYEELINLTTDCESQVEDVREAGYGDKIIQLGNPWYHYTEGNQDHPDHPYSYIIKFIREDDDMKKEFEELLPYCTYNNGLPVTNDQENKLNGKLYVNQKDTWFDVFTLPNNRRTGDEKEDICRDLSYRYQNQIQCELWNDELTEKRKAIETAQVHTLLGVDPLTSALAGGITFLVDKIFGDRYDLYETGCRWENDGKANLLEYEKLLNVW